MAANIESIINQALMEARRMRRIADIYEGSQEAVIALEIYGQTRDELIDDGNWAFSRRAGVPLTLLKGPPPAGGYNLVQPWSAIYPPPGFLFEYLYPDDCIEMHAIIPPPNGFMPDLDPVPALWRFDNDQTPIVSGTAAIGPPAKVILCNTANAMAVYSAQVTDPSLWTTSFTEGLVMTLARKFAQAFGQPMDNATVAIDQREIAEGKIHGLRD